MKTKKILIIDDNKDILNGLGELCQLKNWEPYLATNVPDALVLFNTEEIDLVIIDYHMPMINGLIGVKKIRDISADVPIIVLTVDETQALADEFMLCGATDFALKPIKIPDFLARINVHLTYSKKSNKIEQNYVKGVSIPTLESIEQFMKSADCDLTIDEIAEGTKYAYQTVNRYVNYLIEIKRAEVTQRCGKTGRPKLKYHWIN
jgi:hypothetical protein